jgi:hypothetical protein
MTITFFLELSPEFFGLKCLSIDILTYFLDTTSKAINLTSILYINLKILLL